MIMYSTKLICDPPSGWKYGFPKQVPDDIRDGDESTFIQWLVQSGYPKSIIDSLGKHFFLRFWEEPID